jgi:uncharacterized protein YndB with AHSA1/START domain
MARVSIVIEASPERVWRALSDGWLYPLWVVGATHMRDVDEGYPSPGTKLHHSVGAWPLLVKDDTEVQECEPMSRLVLRASGWPAGVAMIELGLEPVDEPANACRVTMFEEPIEGPGQVAHALMRPVSEWALAKRNNECLGRLKAIVERRNADLLPDGVPGG